MYTPIFGPTSLVTTILLLHDISSGANCAVSLALPSLSFWKLVLCSQKKKQCTRMGACVIVPCIHPYFQWLNFHELYVHIVLWCLVWTVQTWKLNAFSIPHSQSTQSIVTQTAVYHTHTRSRSSDARKSFLNAQLTHVHHSEDASSALQCSPFLWSGVHRSRNREHLMGNNPETRIRSWMSRDNYYVFDYRFHQKWYLFIREQ